MESACGRGGVPGLDRRDPRGERARHQPDAFRLAEVSTMIPSTRVGAVPRRALLSLSVPSHECTNAQASWAQARDDNRALHELRRNRGLDEEGAPDIPVRL